MPPDPKRYRKPKAARPVVGDPGSVGRQANPLTNNPQQYRPRFSPDPLLSDTTYRDHDLYDHELAPFYGRSDYHDNDASSQHRPYYEPYPQSHDQHLENPGPDEQNSEGGPSSHPVGTDDNDCSDEPLYATASSYPNNDATSQYHTYYEPSSRSPKQYREPYKDEMDSVATPLDSRSAPSDYANDYTASQQSTHHKTSSRSHRRHRKQYTDSFYSAADPLESSSAPLDYADDDTPSQQSDPYKSSFRSNRRHRKPYADEVDSVADSLASTTLDYPINDTDSQRPGRCEPSSRSYRQYQNPYTGENDAVAETPDFTTSDYPNNDTHSWQSTYHKPSSRSHRQYQDLYPDDNDQDAETLNSAPLDNPRDGTTPRGYSPHDSASADFDPTQLGAYAPQYDTSQQLGAEAYAHEAHNPDEEYGATADPELGYHGGSTSYGDPTGSDANTQPNTCIVCDDTVEQQRFLSSKRYRPPTLSKGQS